MSGRTCILLAAVFCLTSSGATGEDPDPLVAPLQLIDFRIKDQFDKLHTSGSLQGVVAIVVSGDRKGSGYMGDWVPVLTDTLAAEVNSRRVKIVSHAHLKGVPFFLKKSIRGKFSEDEKNWVLMDWKGEFRQAYDLAEDHCSILVFDRTGARRRQLAVREFDPEKFRGLLADIRTMAE